MLVNKLLINMSRVRFWYQRRKFVEKPSHKKSSIVIHILKKSSVILLENHPLSSDHQRNLIQRIKWITIGSVHLNEVDHLILIQSRLSVIFVMIKLLTNYAWQSSGTQAKTDSLSGLKPGSAHNLFCSFWKSHNLCAKWFLWWLKSARNFR